MPDDSHERTTWAEGELLCGLDEAGAGNLAGSCFLSAVIFPSGFNFELLPKLNDSKKLSDKRRFELEHLIAKYALWHNTAEISHQEIDSNSVYHAKLAAARNMMCGSCPMVSDITVIFDGNVCVADLPHSMNSKCLIKGDGKCYTIAAASILAKCSQRRQMLQMDKSYPEYDFKNNSGYFSDKHAEAIRKYGPTPIHRLKYIRNILRIIN